MAKSEYYEKLQSPRWQRKRLEIYARDGYKCVECGDAKTQLHVHHRYYVSQRDPWDYPDFALITLCKNCHEAVSMPYPDGMWSPWEKAINQLVLALGERKALELVSTLQLVQPSDAVPCLTESSAKEC